MRKSFTRFLSLFMLFSIISLFAVASIPVVTVAPVSPATNVNQQSGSVTFTLTFDQAVFAGTSGAGVIALSNLADVQLDPIQISTNSNTNLATGSTVVINGNVVTITFRYSPIPEQTTFYVTATSDALKNAGGEYWGGWQSFGLAFPSPFGTHNYVFTTGDFTAPTVATVTPFVPADGASAVAIAQIYSVTFSEPVKAGTGLIQTGDLVSKPGNIGLYKENGDVVELFDVTTATATATPGEGAVGILGSVLYINPTDSKLTALGKYYVRILNTAITDNNTTPFIVDNKNIFAGINNNTTWNFQLADATAPTFVVSAAGATSIQQTAVMKMTFADADRLAAGLSFALQKVTGATTVAPLAIGDNVTAMVTFLEDVTGGVGFAATTNPWKATYTAANEVTVEFTTGAKFKTGANYQLDVIANSFANVEYYNLLRLVPGTNMPVLSASSTFKAGDFTAPTAATTYLQQGGYGVVQPLPWLPNSTAGDKETTNLFFGVTTTDNVVPPSLLGTLPTTVKYVVNTSATPLTAPVVSSTGVTLPLIPTTNNTHQGVITGLASNTPYFIHYVAIDAATTPNTSVEYVSTITTSDIDNPTYTVKYFLAAVEQTATAVDKGSKIVVTFNETVADNTNTVFNAASFAGTLTLKQTTPNVTLVYGTDYTVTNPSANVFEIIGTPSTLASNWGLANWMSKGNYSLAIDGSRIFDIAGTNPPYGTANAAASTTNLFTVKDYEGPTVAFVPADAITGVNNNGDITITFSEVPYYLTVPVTNDPTSAGYVDALIELRKGNATTATTGSPLEPRTVSISGNVVTIIPTTKPLSSEIWYRASVSTDITDVNGYKLKWFSDNTSLNPVPAVNQEYSVFKTADNRTPLVTYTTYNGTTTVSPLLPNVFRGAQGLVNVDNIAYPVILLDESVQEIVGNTAISSLDANQIRTLITFKKGDANGPDVEFNVLLAATNITLTPPPTGMFEIVLDPINPGAYDNSGTYYFSITGIQDAAKNPITGSATFTVINSTPLTLDASSPVNGSFGQAKSGNIVLTFNQNVSKTTTSGTFITSVPAGLNIDVTNASVGVSGNQITIPYAGFLANTLYTITIPAGVFTAVANNAPNSLVTRTFTTVDEYGPTIDFGTAALPDEKAPNTVAISNGQLSLTFTEDIVLGNGFIKIRKPELAGATTVADINIQSAYVIIDPTNSKKVKITIPVTLLYNQAYFVEIPQTAFKDAAGNNFQWTDTDHGVVVNHVADVTAPFPFPSPYVFGAATWDFSTVTDATPTYSTFTTFVPAAGSNNVALTAGFTINFSEPVSLATSGIRELTIYRQSDNTSLQTIDLATATLIWVSPTQLTVQHLPFEANKAYYINISPGAFKDATGNAIAILTSTVTALGPPITGTNWFFTTTDQTSPTAVLTTASGAALTAVPLTDNLVLTFSEPVALAGANTWNTALTLSSGTGGFAATLNAAKTILTIDPTSPGADFSSLTSATLTIFAGTIQDLATVPNLIGGSVITLTGEDKTAPVWLITYPQVVTPYAKDKIKFNVALDEKSKVYYKVVVGGTTPAPSASEVRNSAMFDYTLPTFTSNAVKAIEITAGLSEYSPYDVYIIAEDLFGNQTTPVVKLVLNTTDATPPTLSLLTPLNNAVDVNYNHVSPAFNGIDLKIRFSETVNFTAALAKLVVRNYGTNVKVWEADRTGSAGQGTLALANSSSSTTNDVVWVNIPKAVLADQTKYYVEFEYNMVSDVKNGSIGAANNPYADAFIGKADWSFTTADETVPVLAATPPATTTVPAFGAIDIPTAPGTLTMRFSEPIAIGTGTIYIYRVGVAAPQEVIGLPSSDVVVNPANNKELLITRHNTFASEQSFYVVFPATGVKDLAPVPNYYAGLLPTVWNFTIGDFTSPTVVWSPAVLTNVPTATVVTAKFLDPRQTELVGTTYEPLFNSGTAVANLTDIKTWFSVTAGGVPAVLTSAIYTTAYPATVSFAVTGGLLSNTTYVFNYIGPATVTDDKGMVVLSTPLTFSTINNSSPTITFTPATTAPITTVPVGSYVTVKFNRTIYNSDMATPPATSANANATPTAADFATGNYVTFKTSGGALVPFTTEVVTPGVEYRLHPTTDLASTSGYEVVWIADATIAGPQYVYDRLDLATGGNKLVQTLAQRTTNFTTEDVVPPTVWALNPANIPALTIINPNAPLVMTFSEQVKAGAGNIQIRFGNGLIFDEFPASACTYTTGAPWLVTFPHNKDFEKFKTYYVTISGNAITDVSSNANAFLGYSDNTKWAFRTDDGTAPYVISYTPSNGYGDVDVFSNLVLRFSENITTTVAPPVAKNIVIYYKNEFVDPTFGDGNAIEIIPILGNPRVVISGSDVIAGFDSDIMTIDPITKFDKMGSYYVRIDNGAVQDFAVTPNNYAGISFVIIDGIRTPEWSFTVTDYTKPSLKLASNPIDGATGVAKTLNGVSMEFNGAILAGPGSIKLYKYNSSLAESIQIETIPSSAASINPATNTATFDFAAALEDNTDYYILADNGSFTNTASSHDWWPGITDPFTWMFKTGDNAAPTVAAVASAQTGSGNNMSAFTVTLTFNEAVTGVNATNVTAVGGTLGTIVAVSPTVYTVPVTAADLGSVVISLSGGIKDTNVIPNALATTPKTFPVTDNNAPLLTATPNGGAIATNVFTVNLAFNEPVVGVDETSVTVNSGATKVVSGSGKDYLVVVTAQSGSIVTMSFANTIVDVIDPVSNPVAHPFVGLPLTFTVTGDALAPTVAMLTPADGTGFDILTGKPDEINGVVKNPVLIIKFEDKVVAGLATAKLRVYTQDVTNLNTEVFATTLDAATMISTDGLTITIPVTIPLIDNTDYVVLIDAGFVKSWLGVDFAGVSNPDIWNATTWNFRTGDNKAPELTVIPGVQVNTKNDILATLVFTEPVYGLAGAIAVTVNGAAVEPAITGVDGDNIYKVAIHAADLADVSLTVNTTVADKYLRNNLVLPQTFIYKVGDNTAPTIVGEVIPTIVANTITTTITFSEVVIVPAGGISASNITAGSLVVTSADGIVYTVTMNAADDVPVSVIVANTVTDASVNANAFAERTFGPWKAGDNTAPEILSVTPEDGSVKLNNNFTVEVTFDETVTGVADAITVTNGEKGVVTVNGNTYSIPVSAIDGANVTINISNAVTDASGNKFAGKNLVYHVGDNTAPTASVLPTSGATGLPNTFNVFINFMEPVTVPLGAITATGGEILVTPPISGNTYTVAVTAKDGATVTLNVSNAVKDASNNPFAAQDYTYTVGDNTEPVITAVSPADGATNVKGLPISLVLTFNENVLANSSAALIRVYDQTVLGSNKFIWSTPVTSDMILGEVVTVPISIPLSDNSFYTVTVDDGIVKDASNNVFNTGFTDPTRWNFQIGDNTAPTVISVDPPTSAAAEQTFDVTIIFSEVVINVDRTTITVDKGSVVDVVPVGLTGKIYRATITAADGDVVNLTFGSGITDASGNQLILPEPYKYTIGDNTAPTVTAVGPVPADKTPAEFNVVLTFSEEVTGVEDALAGSKGKSGAATTVDGIVYTVAFAGVDGAKLNLLLDKSKVFDDVSANANVLAEGLDLSYTVGDHTGPTVTAVPSSGDNLPKNFSVRLTFSADAIVKTSDITATGATIVVKPIVGNVCDVDVTAADYSTIVITVASTIADASGNLITGTRVFTYYTSDNTAPVIITVNPNGGATENAHPANFEIFVNELVVKGTGKLTVYKKAGDVKTMELDIATVTIVPAAAGYKISIPLSGSLDRFTDYYVLLSEGFVVDASGNKLAAVASKTFWTFKTGDWVTAIDPTIQNGSLFKVYPNPFVEYVNVVNASQLSKIVVTNIVGQTVKEVVNPTDRIQLNELRSGVYFISLYDMDNVIAKTAKIVKR